MTTNEKITTEETKKRRGRPKKVAKEEQQPASVTKEPTEVTTTADEVTTTKASYKKRTGWSDTKTTKFDVCVEYMNVEIMLLRPALGMMPTSDEILRDYIDSKNPEAPSIADDIAAMGAETVERQSTTIWPLGKFSYDEEHDIFIDRFDTTHFSPVESGGKPLSLPFIYDYQIRGMFKDSCGLLARSKNNRSSELKAFKKTIDGGIFVFPRHIAWNIPDTFINEYGHEQSTYDENGMLRTMQRPLRISGPTGERTALASSEVIPAGSTIKFRIGMTSPTYRKAIEEWLDYGLYRGIGQWRNSAIGTFKWRELDDEWNPL